MSSTWGKNIEISIFGESHGNGIGVVINGLPAGEKIDMDKLLAQMARRAPGNDKAATPRKKVICQKSFRVCLMIQQQVLHFVL